MQSGNLFDALPEARTVDEGFSTLAEGSGLRLVRIVSTGHATADGEWYDQDEAEWVVVLRGQAGLRIEAERVIRIMGPGDHILIPAHVRHRVEWTDPKTPTLWLALHFDGEVGRRPDG